MNNYKYFTQRDFDRANPPCKITDMNPGTLRKLDRARGLSGIPYVVNSAARTLEHERKMGRAGTSSHAVTLAKKATAMDISATNSREKWQIVQGLIKAGFNRIFLYKTFIHADDDPAKPAGVFDFYT